MEGGLISFMMPAKSKVSTGMALMMRPAQSLPFEAGAVSAACIRVLLRFGCSPHPDDWTVSKSTGRKTYAVKTRAALCLEIRQDLRMSLQFIPHYVSQY